MSRALVALSMSESGRAPTPEKASEKASAEKRATVAQSALSAADHGGAFAALFAEHAPHVWRAVRGLGVRDADIEDVCQEVFVVVHRKLPSFEGRSSLRTWIYGISLRVVADYRKKAHRTHERLVATPPEVASAALQERVMAQRQAWRILDLLLDALSDDQRRVFVLYELEEVPMREVATILECPLQTAYSRLEAAREVVQRGMAARRLKEQEP